MSYYVMMPGGEILADTKSNSVYEAWQQVVGCSDMTESFMLINFWMNEGYSVVEQND